MSLANTLSVLLNFKTDLSGLEKFATNLRSRLEQVQEFNKKVTNGAAAVNNALSVAAGYFAVGSLRSYIAEALEARSAQAKLAQALTQTKQNTAAYRGELGAQATALQKVTGMEDEVIAGVQRQLVFGGAQRKDIAALTQLTLDFAAAKEIDAVSAAKAVARALQGEGDELKRYGVEVDLSRNKTAGLIEGLSKFSGQAAQAFASLPEGMRELQLASKEAKQSAGEAVLAISGPFLSGLASGLATVKERLDGIGSSGSIVGTIFKTLSGLVGSFVGQNLGKLAALAAGLLALKAGSYMVNESIKVLTSGFLLFTGQSLPAMIMGLQSLSKEVGILQALVVGGKAGLFAVIGAGVGAAAIGFTIGQAIGEGIKNWQQGKVNDAKAGNAVVSEVTTAADAISSEQDRVSVLERAKRLYEEIDQKRRDAAAGTSYSEAAMGVYYEQLVTLRTAINGLEGDWARERIATNEAANSAERYAASVRDAAAWLKSDDATKDRETVAAGVESRQSLDERLSNARAYLAINERSLAFVQKVRADGKSDASIEKMGLQALAEKERTLAKIAELEKAARTQQNNDLSRRIGAGDTEISKIENTAILTDRQKSAQILPLLDEQNKLIAERIALREKELDLADTDTTRDDLQKEIDTLRQQLAEKRGKATNLGAPETRIQAAEKGVTDLSDPSKHYQGMGEGARGGLLEYLAEVGTMADQVAASIKSTLNSAVSSVSSNLTGWIMRTQTWKQTLTNIRTTIMQQLLQSIIQMGVQWLLNSVIIKGAMMGIEALMDALRSKRVTKENTAEAATLPAKTAGAAASGISSLGTALVFGALAIAIIMAAMGGFEVGGYTEPGAKNKAVGVVHAGEWVAPKWMVEDEQYGAMIGALESARNGAEGFSSGGLFGKLTKSMQKTFGWKTWGQFLGSGGISSKLAPGQAKLQEQWNLLDGTKLYGGEASDGGETRTLTSAELASAIASRDSEGSSSSDYTATMPNQSSGSSSSGATASADSQQVNVSVYGYIDVAALKADLRRDPTMNKHIVNLMKNA